MMIKVKKVFPYIGLFLFFILALQFFYQYYALDTYSNYGFSYGIIKGEIPYNDFNLVVPLVGPFIYATLLFINHSTFTFFLEQAIILTIMSYFIFKTLGRNKAYLFLICLLMPPLVSAIYPGYNFLLILFFILLLYLETNNKSDKLIGLLLGIIILTKQSVGFFLLIPSVIYFFKKRNKLIIRLKYFLIPLVIFFLYLVFTKSLFNFFNMTILGMIDFSKKNTNIDYPYLIIILSLLIINVIKIIKTKDITYTYLLMTSSLLIPIIDRYHCSLYIILFIYVLLLNKKSDFKYKITTLNFLIIISFVSIGTLFVTILYPKNVEFHHYHNFPFIPLTTNYKEKIDELNEFTKNKEIIYLIFSNEINIMLPCMNEEKINYYTLLNNGNHGYKGTQMLLKRLQKEKDKYIVMDNVTKRDKFSQSMFELADYVKQNYRKIKSIGIFDIYYKK